MIFIDRSSSTPLFEQIYDQLVRDILSGQLSSGTILPATRKLAEDLAVSRNTIDRAYQQLKAEGYVSSLTGSGFSVNDIPPRRQQPLPKPVAPKKKPMSPPPRYDFVYGSMSADLFPFRSWARCTGDVLAELGSSPVISYPPRIGEPRLQEQLCDHLYESRGVRALPEQIIITCGHQHSMEILCNMFQDLRHFTMENPGYDGIREVFRNHPFEIHPVPLDQDGISLEGVRKTPPGLLCLTPSHQFPSGSVLSVAKRRQLLDWADETGSWIIEDDYDSELRYYTNPVPSMQSMDSTGRIIYCGTFSKSLSPAMRVAYMVLPPAAMERFQSYYHRYNSQVTPLHQLALAEFMKRGHYTRHINRLRTIYRKKISSLLAAISSVFGDQVTVRGGDAGLHILMEVHTDLSQEELVARAAAESIRLYPTRNLYLPPLDPPEHELLLGFSTVPEEKFPEIMQKLAGLWGLRG